MFGKIAVGLSKTRKSVLSGIKSLLTFSGKIDEELLEELEATLITADIGINTVQQIIEEIKYQNKKEKIKNKDDLFSIVENKLKSYYSIESDCKLKLYPVPAVIIIVGVNGTGKTTTIGKLAYKLKSEGKKVLLAAADTFRAAAIDQLEIWGKRANVPVIKHTENSDPSAVVYDAVNAAIARKLDCVIIDTAGRLHTKNNLMEEIKKIKKVVEKLLPHPISEILLVLDGTTGQNAVNQAKTFKEALDLTGLVITKLDGTAKGGIVIAIKRELNLPVKLIGVGEKIDDLEEFNPEEYIKAIFEE